MSAGRPAPRSACRASRPGIASAVPGCPRGSRTPRWASSALPRVARLAIVALLGAGLAGCAGSSPSALGHGRVPAGGKRTLTQRRTAATTTTTTTTLPVVAPPGVLGPLTSPPLPPAQPGFEPGVVTAVGDSVMIDAQGDLQQDIPGIQVNAAVSRQWSDGEDIFEQLKSSGQLGAVVVVELGTNGPITSGDFSTMMTILSGASRVVFVTVHVDRPWQDQVNQVIETGAQGYPNAVVADWYSLGSDNPGWFYSDDTHLPIGGPGAQALAQLIATAV